jgi:CHAT domain-containing protein
MTLDNLIAALLAAPDVSARRALLDSRPESINLAFVQKLKEAADEVERDDGRQALSLGIIGEEIAEQLNDPAARALALWAQANAYEGLGEYETAVQTYSLAAASFQRAGRPLEAARTSIGHLNSLIYLGLYAEAQALAEEARAVFVSQGDAFSRAKIDMNMGNLYDRLGNPNEALAAFQQAVTTFDSLGESLYAAMARANSGNSLIQIDNFIEAEALYAKARPVFETEGLRFAVAMIDHDLALLQQARGQYALSFRTLERARLAFTTLGVDLQIAQIDLNESDLYLELNLLPDTLRLAQQAEQAFAKLNLNFELARARANRAIALARLKPNQEAIQLLSEAQALFQASGNEIWATHAELQRAEVLGQLGAGEQARDLLIEVAKKYQRLGLKTKQAYANLVAVGWLTNNQQWVEALAALRTIQEALNTLSVPWLAQRLETEYGRVYEGLGDWTQAIHHYKAAVEQIESIATAISAEEHRTAFLANKTTPYEGLVTLLAGRDPAQALAWTERAKSRAMVDLLAGKVNLRLRLNATDAVDQHRAETLQTLREELNWLYTRLTWVAGPNDSGPPIAGPEILPKIQEKEQKVMALWHDLQAKHAESISLEHVSPLSVEEIQKTLPESTKLVEYFIARDQVLAFVVDHDHIRVHPALTSLSAVQSLLEKLAFQFSKFQYGPAYYQRHQSILYETTLDILDQLYQQLLAPLWPELSEAESLIIVPHGPLHALPFHALYREGQPLLETHTISYAPSAAVLQFCWKKTVPSQGSALLLGIPDDSISQVTNEVETLARQLPGSVALLGQDATYARLCELAPSCNILHLATHGLFRPDAPLLSGVRLADRWLAAQDVYDLDLHQASLVTLSACESGLGQVAGGDDVVGLARGFLYAGAASLLVSLWRVADETMTGLMDTFYKKLLAGETKALALRGAQRALMTTHPHPYFWAPLALLGSER